MYLLKVNWNQYSNKVGIYQLLIFIVIFIVNFIVNDLKGKLLRFLKVKIIINFYFILNKYEGYKYGGRAFIVSPQS